MNCKYCESQNTTKNGRHFNKGTVYQKIRCKDCGRESYVRTSPEVITNTEIMKSGITEKELREKHDVTFKITKAAESMIGDVFYTEFDFIKLCGIPSGSGFRHIVDSGLFDKYKGKAGGTVYWSNPGNIQKLKNEGVLK